jgi:hypothetical protein
VALLEIPRAGSSARLQELVHCVDVRRWVHINSKHWPLLIRTTQGSQRRPSPLESRSLPVSTRKLESIGRVTATDRDTREINLTMANFTEHNVFGAHAKREERRVPEAEASFPDGLSPESLGRSPVPGLGVQVENDPNKIMFHQSPPSCRLPRYSCVVCVPLAMLQSRQVFWAFSSVLLPPREPRDRVIGIALRTTRRSRRLTSAEDALAAGPCLGRILRTLRESPSSARTTSASNLRRPCCTT